VRALGCEGPVFDLNGVMFCTVPLPENGIGFPGYLFAVQPSPPKASGPEQTPVAAAPSDASVQRSWFPRQRAAIPIRSAPLPFHRTPGSTWAVISRFPGPA
jgi:hypothetical protein